MYLFLCGIEQWLDFAVPYLCDASEKGFSSTTKVDRLYRNGSNSQFCHPVGSTVPTVPSQFFRALATNLLALDEHR